MFNKIIFKLNNNSKHNEAHFFNTKNDKINHLISQ